MYFNGIAVRICKKKKKKKKRNRKDKHPQPHPHSKTKNQDFFSSKITCHPFLSLFGKERIQVNMVEL